MTLTLTSLGLRPQSQFSMGQEETMSITLQKIIYVISEYSFVTKMWVEVGQKYSHDVVDLYIQAGEISSDQKLSLVFEIQGMWKPHLAMRALVVKFKDHDSEPVFWRNKSGSKYHQFTSFDSLNIGAEELILNRELERFL